MKKFITTQDKGTIKEYCNKQIENKDKIRVKYMATMLEKKYATYELMDYIRDDLRIDKKLIAYGNCNYWYKLERGHIQLSESDLYYANCYIHQYMVCMELDVEIEQIQKYIIHHMDEDKGKNDISNLWVFYDTNNHIAYHQAILHGENVDLMRFTLDYIESILDKENVEEIRAYLKILYKAERLKKESKRMLILATQKASINIH